MHSLPDRIILVVDRYAGRVHTKVPKGPMTRRLCGLMVCSAICQSGLTWKYHPYQASDKRASDTDRQVRFRVRRVRDGEEWMIVGITVFDRIPLQALQAHLSARSAGLEHTLQPWVCTFGQQVANPCINDPERHCDRCCKLWHMHPVPGGSILQRLWFASIACYML